MYCAFISAFVGWLAVCLLAHLFVDWMCVFQDVSRWLYCVLVNVLNGCFVGCVCQCLYWFLFVCVCQFVVARFTLCLSVCLLAGSLRL